MKEKEPKPEQQNSLKPKKPQKQSAFLAAIKKHYRWFVFIIVLSFAIAFAFGLATELLVTQSIIVCVSIIVVLIAVAFIGDIFAVAVAYADIGNFNAMASRRKRGAKMSIRLIKNSDKVSSILSDILGDVCGIISGAMGVALALVIIDSGNFATFQQVLIIALVNAVIAMTAITAKSIAKKIAIKNSTKIVLFFGKVLSYGRKR